MSETVQCSYVSQRTLIKCIKIVPKNQVDSLGYCRKVPRRSRQATCCCCRTGYERTGCAYLPWSYPGPGRRHLEHEQVGLAETQEPNNQHRKHILGVPGDFDCFGSGVMLTPQEFIRMSIKKLENDIRELQDYERFLEMDADDRLQEAYEKAHEDRENYGRLVVATPQQRQLKREMLWNKHYQKHKHFKRDYREYLQKLKDEGYERQMLHDGERYQQCACVQKEQTVIEVNPDDVDGNVKLVTDLMLAKVCGDQTVDEVEKASLRFVSKDVLCNSTSLPYSKYCFDHILLDKNQVLMSKCTVCTRPVLNAFNEGDTRCSRHLARYSRNVHTVRDQSASMSPMLDQVMLDPAHLTREMQKTLALCSPKDLPTIVNKTVNAQKLIEESMKTPEVRSTSSSVIDFSDEEDGFVLTPELRTDYDVYRKRQEAVTARAAARESAFATARGGRKGASKAQLDKQKRLHDVSSARTRPFHPTHFNKTTNRLERQQMEREQQQQYFVEASQSPAPVAENRRKTKHAIEDNGSQPPIKRRVEHAPGHSALMPVEPSPIMLQPAPVHTVTASQPIRTAAGEYYRTAAPTVQTSRGGGFTRILYRNPPSTRGRVQITPSGTTNVGTRPAPVQQSSQMVQPSRSVPQVVHYRSLTGTNRRPVTIIRQSQSGPGTPMVASRHGAPVFLRRTEPAAQPQQAANSSFEVIESHAAPMEYDSNYAIGQHVPPQYSQDQGVVYDHEQPGPSGLSYQSMSVNANHSTYASSQNPQELAAPASQVPEQEPQPSMDFLLDGIDAVTGLPIGVEETEEVPDYSLFVSGGQEDVDGICAAASEISHAPPSSEPEGRLWFQREAAYQTSVSNGTAKAEVSMPEEQDEDSVDNLSLLASAAVTQTQPAVAESS
ncbi:hypothetical protein L596_018559 [Steinernema carpocapsae]|uniref:KAT8 regulatory NSL complex subunit 2 n=1 Tax=Steinernema carpocapsae TaxID=34508 RepID=A0A4V6A238_STECR|nr:hypothetical protein L596_018559 [Steinernema carpocapsae]